MVEGVVADRGREVMGAWGKIGIAVEAIVVYDDQISVGIVGCDDKAL